MEYYVGIDLGGTNIKAGVVDEHGTVLSEDSYPTYLPRPAEAVADDIAIPVNNALKDSGLTLKDISGIGVGCPGIVDAKTGVVVCANNLDWENFSLASYLYHKIGIPVKVANDADVAALGEVCSGSAKGCESAVIITLGTGVGCGIVLNGRIYTGHNGAASEFGHTVVEYNGWDCRCGKKGCLEAYASATGLIKMTKLAIEENPNSIMAKVSKVDGQTAFTAMKQGDTTAAKVVDQYISYLACGLANIINGIQPEIISLGGGIAKEGEGLLVPIREKLNGQIFGGPSEKYTKIKACTLGYKAGIIGAAMQFLY